MAYTYNIFSIYDGSDIYFYDNTDVDNKYFQFESATKASLTNNATDFGQVFVSDVNPTTAANGAIIYNPATNSYFGDTGNKITEQIDGTDHEGKSVGGITFLEPNDVDKFIFKRNPIITTQYRIVKYSNGAETNQYVVYNSDTGTVFLYTTDNIDNANNPLPNAIRTDWMVLGVNKDAPFDEIPS